MKYRRILRLRFAVLMTLMLWDAARSGPRPTGASQFGSDDTANPPSSETFRSYFSIRCLLVNRDNKLSEAELHKLEQRIAELTVRAGSRITTNTAVTRDGLTCEVTFNAAGFGRLNDFGDNPRAYRIFAGKLIEFTVTDELFVKDSWAAPGSAVTA